MLRSSDRIRQLLFHSIVVTTTLLVPFSFSLRTLDPGIHFRFMVWAACLCILAISVLVAILKYRDLRSETCVPTGSIVFGMLFFLSSAAGFAVAINPQDWLYTTLRTGLFVTHAYLFSLILLWNRDRWESLVWYTTAVGFLVALIGILQWGGDMFLIGVLNPPYATMMHENLFASFLFLSTPLALYGAFRWKGFRQLFFITTLVVMMIAVVISTTRAVWAALTIGAVLTGLVYVIADRKLGVETLGKTGVQKRIAALLLVFVLLAGAGTFISLVSDHFDDLEERTLIWRNTLEIAAAHPLLGVGAGNWVQYTNIENMQNRISQASWIRPHNDPLWVLSETGIFGLIGYLGLFMVSFWMLWRVLRVTENGKTRLLSLAVLFALVGFFLVSNSGFPRERIEHTAYFAMFLALSALVYRLEFPGKRLSGRSIVVYLSVGFIVLLSGFSAMVGWYRVDGESHVTIAHGALAQQQWRAVSPQIEQAKNPFYSAHPNGARLEYMNGIAKYELKQYEQALENFQQAYAHNNVQIMTWWWLARSHFHVRDYENSVHFFELCLEKWPNNVFSLPGLSMAEYNLGRFEEAYEHLYYYRQQFDPQRHRESHDNLWNALQARLGPERIAELDLQFDVPEMRRQERKRDMKHEDILRDK
jgi:O-antigen ligase